MLGKCEFCFSACKLAQPARSQDSQLTMCVTTWNAGTLKNFQFIFDSGYTVDPPLDSILFSDYDIFVFCLQVSCKPEFTHLCPGILKSHRVSSRKNPAAPWRIIRDRGATIHASHALLNSGSLHTRAAHLASGPQQTPLCCRSSMALCFSSHTLNPLASVASWATRVAPSSP